MGIKKITEVKCADVMGICGGSCHEQIYIIYASLMSNVS